MHTNRIGELVTQPLPLNAEKQRLCRDRGEGEGGGGKDSPEIGGGGEASAGVARWVGARASGRALRKRGETQAGGRGCRLGGGGGGGGCRRGAVAKKARQRGIDGVTARRGGSMARRRGSIARRQGGGGKRGD
ncbi:hypothetical protein E2562_034536 [Oryza meyeriana var. granulata]|uniref:Uncharacterized protein n=1 Tax=Oryza meyeriana var. granulata TaxID=110450 RepID=A0A6G1CAU7_9ORYZ|nr:hypothetical protein E2562_034536 [Oryza meyeriana var. granulata]